MNRLKFVLVWALCFLAINNVACQNSREILSNIENLKKKEIDSLLYFSKDKKKLEYLAVLPSINYNFFFFFFNVEISLSNLSIFFLTKQLNKI